ncbi:hypothetical protein KIW84_014203 [Lathyrus oleraceus]|uniref:SWIM-type domain-containing protein n=1 Tax=Pisum sativum TaxID=3888 RepID=A0A9D5GZ80_PEA|nr:hypothetical protein KIW84_014203 [Pisum sativum]
MKLNEVGADVRLRYATEIRCYRYFKAIKLARQIVEGESSKQYSLLWSYGAELRRAPSGNIFKVNINCPTLGLQPRFARCYICFDGTRNALTKACIPFTGLDGCHIKHKYGGRLTFQVRYVLFTDSFLMDLTKQTCSCNYWNLVGIPCRHGVAAIQRKVDDPIKYVGKCYHKSTYEKCYNEVITLLNGQDKCPKTSDPMILPPMLKCGPSRPKKVEQEAEV